MYSFFVFDVGRQFVLTKCSDKFAFYSLILIKIMFKTATTPLGFVQGGVGGGAMHDSALSELRAHPGQLPPAQTGDTSVCPCLVWFITSFFS